MTTTRKRLILATLGLVLVAQTALPPASLAAEDGGSRSLRSLAMDHGVFIGTMFANVGEQYRQEEAATNRVLKHACLEFNMLTPGNALKFEVVHPAENTYAWMPAESLVATASHCGMRVVGSTLVWFAQIPKWVLQYDGQPDKVRAILRKHITQVVRHFAGRIAVWDVVNEAVLRDGSLRNNFWFRNLGPGYVADSFRWARKADPAAKLYYNDYGNEGLGVKSEAVYAWVQKWLLQGAPIDGVGLEMHTTMYGPSYGELVTNMRRYAELGLQTRISEMDVGLDSPVGDGRLNAQALTFHNAAKACFSAGTGCKMLTVWGLTDRYWSSNLDKHRHCCGVLLDENYAKKPAYHALSAALR